ncbi:MAG: S9 family peptidase [Lachnospiraceae bacterium]|nr:S9 family peptidase [Lachnospiraceae bacterium]
MDAAASGRQNVSHLNDKVLEGKYVALPERIDYSSCGLDLHGWVLLPEGYKEAVSDGTDKLFPAVLDVHGGPRCVYSTQYFHEMQVWVSRGYVVMFTNIKGSDGRGDEFADIRGDYGGTDFQNLMDFVDTVLEKYPNIDKNRLCETGGSYGGFMTNWIITHTDRFCAAASQRSIANWVSMSLISDIGPWFGPDQCIREIHFTDSSARICSPEVVEKLWDRSPLKYAENVSTPTLFIHSDQDYRCPMPEGMQMMQALSVHGVPARLVLFHGENHELSRGGKPLHRIRRLTEISDWFDKYAKEN